MPEALPGWRETNGVARFVADELIEAGVSPETLLQAQGFDPAPLALLKANFNQAQPRVRSGNGRESGEWTSDGLSNREAGLRLKARPKLRSNF
jgi:hypothetical protein